MGITLIYEDAEVVTYQHETPIGVVTETFRKTPVADPVGDAFIAEQQAKEAAEFEAFKARSGEPAYKAAAVHIAAEKLGVLTAIETAIDALISRAGDKSLFLWWEQIDTISRADAEWQQIEAATEWPKDVTAADLFDLAATI